MPRGSRRGFIKQAGAAAIASLSRGAARSRASALSNPLDKLTVVRNRAPLADNTFYMLPLGSIMPAGWLKRQLRIQANGLSGHLDETWADVGSNSSWLGGTGEAWERGPYYLDGLIPLAYLLDDAALKAKAQKYVDWTLDHQAADGMIGPGSNNDWWPRMVMLKALTQYHEATGDARVIPVMSRYFAHQLAELPHRPLRDWGKFRWQDNALSAIWLFNRSGDTKLLDLVRILHEQGFDWMGAFENFKFTQPVTPEMIKLNEGQGLGDLALATHGVNNGQALKAAPVWSLIAKDERSRRGFAQMLGALDTYHGLPNGMFSCDEHLAGRNASQGTELCTVVETMFSLEQSLAILGDATIADRLEKIAFNALPGTFTDDMWAHQYNQEPNQVEVSLHRKPWTTDGPESNLFGLEPNFGCCTANYHQGWPKLATSLWMYSKDDGLVAAVYSPCEVRTSVRDQEVYITEDTDYPFKGAIRFTITPAAPIKFPLRLRIPAWAAEISVLLNGVKVTGPIESGFLKIDRVWKSGDTVEVQVPMNPRVTRGTENSVSIERGPLVFSYPIGESWVKLRDRGLTADWQIFPRTQWNYALSTTENGEIACSVEETAVGKTPFSLAEAAVAIKAKARKVPAWLAVDGVADPVPRSPLKSAEAEEEIGLVPYAAAKLRITAFPTVRS